MRLKNDNNKILSFSLLIPFLIPLLIAVLLMFMKK
jgi:hypothetical protein